MAIKDYLPEWKMIWDEVAGDPRRFFQVLRARHYIDDATYVMEMKLLPPPGEPTKTLKESIAAYLAEYVPKVEEELLELGEEVKVAVYRPIVDYAVAAAQPILEDLWSMVARGGKALEDAARAILRELWAWLRENVPKFLAWFWKETKPQRDWLRENVPLFLDWIWGHVKAAFEQYWPPVEEAIEKGGRTVFDWTVKNLLHGGHVTPEMAPGMAAKMFGVALTAGITAHAMSVGFELMHPFKELGFHQMTGMIAQLGSFGPVTAATLGQIHYAALRRPMMYACNKVTRSQIPDEKLLIEFRSKREIDKAEFLEAMAYQGFSDKWIEIIERWQWKDPRMFELMRVADIGIEQGPPPSSEMWWFNRFGITGEKLKDWWLYRKLMRAGYEDVDLDVLVRTIHRREISFAMTYVRTAVRRNYRWGFLTDTELDEWIDRLLLPKQAKTWISWAGGLDREYFYRNDLKDQYKMAYRNDLIDGDELHLSLLLLGLPIRNVREIVTTERIRKSPRVRREAAAPQRAAMSKIQIKHTQLYIEQYRKGLIDKDGLLRSLMAIDIQPELAELTCELEETKLLPKPKLESVYP